MRQSEVRIFIWLLDSFSPSLENSDRTMLVRTGSEWILADINIVAEVMRSFPSSLALTPSESVDSTASGHPENAPVLTLFDNPVMSRSDHPATPSGHSPSADGLSLNDKAIRSQLLSLLPPCRDLQKILFATRDWWKIWLSRFPELDESGSRMLQTGVVGETVPDNPVELAK